MPTGIPLRWAAEPSTLVGPSSDHQCSTTQRQRGSLYIRRSYETMVGGAMSWSVYRLARDTRQFGDLRVGLSSAIA